jgi:hypothetical protein
LLLRGRPLALPAVALRVTRTVRLARAASQVHKPVVRQAAKREASRVRRPALHRVAAPLVVVRKRAALTGARLSCGASMNRLVFSTVEFGQNSKYWRRTVPRVRVPQATALVPARMLPATGRVLRAMATPLMAKMAKAARVAKAARTAA